MLPPVALYLDLNPADDLTLPVEIRVKQGMALLDEKHGPDWVWRINLDTLVMSHACQCVLGQLYPKEEQLGGYWGAKRALGLEHHETIGYGFMCDGNEWGALTPAWKAAISARRSELE